MSVDIVERITAIENRLQELKSIGTPGNYGAGGILFGGTGGKAEVDATNLFWDNTNDRLGIGTNAPATRLDIQGTNNSYGSGPHIDFTTSTDTHQQLQILPYAHDNINITFDGYFDGTNWKSSDAGSNHQIRKSGDRLSMFYSSGISAGSNITWNEGLSLGIDGYTRLNGVDIRYGADAFSLANNAVARLGATNNFVFVFVHAGGLPAIYVLNGGNHTVNEISDVSGAYTPTAGTAASINIYWSAGNNRYEIENKRGSTINFRIWLLDAP